jgi:hypothetical protein
MNLVSRYPYLTGFGVNQAQDKDQIQIWKIEDGNQA